MAETNEINNDINSKHALKFILLIGVVSLFADTTYEGARSIAGPFLGYLGATGLIVGTIVGLGELIGYSIRMVSGVLSDKMKNYWAITFTGYFINLLAVPLLALTGSWQIAAILIIAERFGKGIRNPPRDAMLSHAGSKIGSGKAFAIHEALDQTGAFIGPIMLAVILFIKGDTAFRDGYALLLIPALLALITLVIARNQFPHPKNFEDIIPYKEGTSFPKDFWIFFIGMALVAAGFADFPLIALHLQSNSVIKVAFIPALYALAMVIDAFAAIIFGYLYDQVGAITIAVAAFISSFSAFFAFGSTELFVIIGVTLWGISLGAQETLIGAIIGAIVPKNKRSTAYGIFNTGYGFAWFAGSIVIGYFLDINILSLMVFSFIIQLVAVVVLVYVSRIMSKRT